MTKRMLITRENNSMSLSCYGEMIIEDGVIISKSFKGMPRTSGDKWVRYYKNATVGDAITRETIGKILEYNGRANVVSSITNIK